MMNGVESGWRPSYAIALDDYNRSREGDIAMDKDVGLEETERIEEVQRLLKVSNSSPCKSNRAQLRFCVGQHVDCWVVCEALRPGLT